MNYVHTDKSMFPCNTYLCTQWVFVQNCVRDRHCEMLYAKGIHGKKLRFFPVVFTGSSPLPLLSACIGRRERLGRCFDSWGGSGKGDCSERRRQQKSVRPFQYISSIRCWNTHILWLWNGAWAVPILSYVDLCVHSWILQRDHLLALHTILCTIL